MAYGGSNKKTRIANVSPRDLGPATPPLTHAQSMRQITGGDQLPATGRSGGYHMMSLSNPLANIIPREVINLGFDVEELENEIGLEIWELLPKPKVYPLGAPVSGKVYAANWSRVINFGGLTDKNKSVDIEQINDWNIAQWTERHKWPKDYTLDPTYLFFTQDPPIFYVQNAVSYINPETAEVVDVSNEDIIWKLDGKEVHRGWFLQLGELDSTIQLMGDVPVIIPRILTVEFHNKKGFIESEIKFAAVNSDNADDLALAGVESEEDNFTSTMEGVFVPDAATKSVVFETDERYGERIMYARFQWQDIGSAKKEAPVRKFKKNCKLKVDGVTVFNDKANILDGQRSAFGEFINDVVGPFFATLATTIIPVVALVSSAQLISGNKKGLYSKIWDDKGKPLDDDRPLSERDVTDWTDGRDSALLYTDKDNDEWNSLVEFTKRPGPFDIEIEYEYTFRKGWFNWGKKYRRTYKLEVDYTNSELHLDVPLQPIDLGVFTIPYSDVKT